MAATVAATQTLGPGTYWLTFADPHPKVVGAEEHPAWRDQVAALIRARYGADVAIVGAGPTWVTHHGVPALVWGVRLVVRDSTSPTVSAPSGAGIVPAQIGVVAVSVAAIAWAIAAVILAGDTRAMVGDLLSVTKVTAGPGGSLRRFASAAQLAAAAGLVIAVTLLLFGRSRI